eukprot:1154852-Pelagomonas_calceolata.AAC.3
MNNKKQFSAGQPQVANEELGVEGICMRSLSTQCEGCGGAETSRGHPSAGYLSTPPFFRRCQQIRQPG